MMKRFNSIFFTFFALVSSIAPAVVSCKGKLLGKPDEDIIYTCPKYTMRHDSMVENDTVVRAVSAFEIKCDDDSLLNWKIDSLPKGYPRYQSDVALMDALFNKSIETIARKGIIDHPHRVEASWLAYNYLLPEAATDTLLSMVEKHSIISNTKALIWPVSSDRSSWVIAAEELSNIKGDRGLRRKIIEAASNTINIDLEYCMNRSTGVVYGSQTYLLPQPMLYPEWMEAVDIYQSPCLGTNVLLAAAIRSTVRLAKTEGVKSRVEEALSDSLRSAINTTFWQPNLGYYSAYVYCYPYTIQLQATDNMAQALGVLTDVFTPETSRSIIRHTPVFDQGVPTLFPMPRSYRLDVDESMQPMVQSFWNLACSKVRNETAANIGMASLMRLALSSPHRNLTAPGIIASVFKGFAGMKFVPDGIDFNPFVPSNSGKMKKISSFRYRDAILDIEINGTGDSIATFTIDGKKSLRNHFPDTMRGKHNIVISMTSHKKRSVNGINRSVPIFMPTTPVVHWINKTNALISNNRLDYDYELMVNGQFQTMIKNGHYRLFSTKEFTTINFLPVLESTWVGFSQQPYKFYPEGTRFIINVRDNRINLHNLPPGKYIVVLTFSGLKPGHVAIARIKNTGGEMSRPVVFYPSEKRHTRSSAVTIDIVRHREFYIEPALGPLPGIEKAILTKL